MAGSNPCCEKEEDDRGLAKPGDGRGLLLLLLLLLEEAVLDWGGLVEVTIVNPLISAGGSGNDAGVCCLLLLL